MTSSRKLIGTDTRVLVSRTLLRMSAVNDSRGRRVFRGSFTPESDSLGLLVFLDMFPNDPFPHLCRYTFIRVNGIAETVDSLDCPALDLSFDLK